MANKRKIDNKLCPKCKGKLYISVVVGYSYECRKCNENFYEFEVWDCDKDFANGLKGASFWINDVIDNSETITKKDRDKLYEIRDFIDELSYKLKD
jgi:hypothetical protein